MKAELPCQFSYKFASVAGHGEAELVEDPQEKMKAMKILMSQYSDKEYEFNERLVSIVSVIKIKVTDFTGRASR